MSDGGHTKACVMCRSDIPVDARICTECNSYQGWWGRNIGRLAFFAGGIAAMFPLVEAACSLNKLVERNRAEVHVPAAHCGAQSVSLEVVNFGQGPAFIGAPSLQVSGEAYGTDASMRLVSDSGIEILKPLDSAVLKYHAVIGTGTATAFPLAKSADCRLKFTMTVEDAEGHKVSEATCDCPSS